MEKVAIHTDLLEHAAQAFANGLYKLSARLVSMATLHHCAPCMGWLLCLGCLCPDGQSGSSFWI
jgi:hypothetical protein